MPQIIGGAASLTGRTLIQRRPVDLEPEPLADEWLPAMPSTCLRTMHSFRPDCPVECPGRQRDTSCLCDVVRAAAAQGIQWRFEVDADGYWVYTGPPLDVYTSGQVYTPEGGEVYTEGDA